jgi:calcium-dependent protein kinase
MGNLLGCLKPVSEQRLVAPVVKDDVEVALLAASAELNRSQLRCFEKDYTLGKLIGHGAFAKVYACTHVHSGREFAVKVLQVGGPAAAAPSVATCRESNPALHCLQKAADKGRQRESLIKEIAIMRMLEQHPYEDAVSYHLVMELCTGGELFDKVGPR